MNADFGEAWVAINTYTRLVAELATCKVAGHPIDSTEKLELRRAKMAVDLELTRLTLQTKK